MALWGLFIPQNSDMVTLSQSYPPVVTYLVAAFDLNQIEKSWITHLLLILLALHIMARWLTHMLASSVPQNALNSDIERRVVSAENADESAEQWLFKWKAGRHIERTSPTRVRARSGYRREGLVFLAISFLAFALSLYFNQRSATHAQLSLMTGEGDDARTQARYVGRQLVAGKWLTWKPPFTMNCGNLLAESGERQCRIGQPDERYEVTLKPGVDILFNGFRMTLIGEDRVTGMSGFEIEATAPGELARFKGAVGRSFDINHTKRLLSSVLLSGTSPEDPTALFPGPGADPERLSQLQLKLSPRTELHFKISKNTPLAFVAGGVFLFLLSLLLLVIVPAYTVEIDHSNSNQWRLSIVGFGLLATPKHEAENALKGQRL